jgi:hypothetical protein
MINLELTPEEYNALTTVLDAGVRAAGLQALSVPFYSVITKLAAVANSQRAPINGANENINGAVQ